MNDADESELHRLCAELEQIDLQNPISDSQREALKKAAMALSIVFSHNLRQTLEQQYSCLGERAFTIST
jgi:hypothetical protein